MRYPIEDLYLPLSKKQRAKERVEGASHRPKSSGELELGLKISAVLTNYASLTEARLGGSFSVRYSNS